MAAFEGPKIDSRTRSFTATVEINEVVSAGMVGPTTYANDARPVQREVNEVARITVRAENPKRLIERLQLLIESGAFG